MSNLQAVACSASGDASSLDIDVGGGLRSDLQEEAEIDLRGHAPEAVGVFYASETPAEDVVAPVEAVRRLDREISVTLISCLCFSDSTATIPGFHYHSCY